MRKKLGERNNDFYGHNENQKKGGGESKLSLPPIFLFSPDALHPAGGIYAAVPVAVAVPSRGCGILLERMESASAAGSRDDRPWWGGGAKPPQRLSCMEQIKTCRGSRPNEAQSGGAGAQRCDNAELRGRAVRKNEYNTKKPAARGHGGLGRKNKISSLAGQAEGAADAHCR